MAKKIFPSEEYFCQSCGDYCRDNEEHYEARLCVDCFADCEEKCDCGQSIDECICFVEHLNSDNHGIE